MRALLLLSLLLFFSSPSCKPTGAVPDLCTSTTRSLSYTTFQSIEAALVEQMELAEKDGDIPGSFYKKEVLADVAGGFLRLAFHDACGYDQEADDSFGPDGCFVGPNVNPGNAGLEFVAEDVDKLWAPYCATISRADFWVLAAKVAVEYTSGGNTSFTFRYGRTTAKSCEYEGSNRLPAATAGLADSKRVFQKQMGLTIRAMVALFGDNNYYTTLLRDGWQYSKTNAGTQWNRVAAVKDHTIMLNTDMALVFDAIKDKRGVCGPVVGGSAGSNECALQSDASGANGEDGYNDDDDGGDGGTDDGNGSPYTYVSEFAENQTAFFVAFGEAMQAMVELGYPNSTLKTVQLPTTTTATNTTSTTMSTSTSATNTTVTTATTTTTTTRSATSTATNARVGLATDAAQIASTNAAPAAPPASVSATATAATTAESAAGDNLQRGSTLASSTAERTGAGTPATAPYLLNTTAASSTAAPGAAPSVSTTVNSNAIGAAVDAVLSTPTPDRGADIAAAAVATANAAIATAAATANANAVRPATATLSETATAGSTPLPAITRLHGNVVGDIDDSSAASTASLTACWTASPVRSLASIVVAIMLVRV
eukprot:gene8873-25639_t